MGPRSTRNNPSIRGGTSKDAISCSGRFSQIAVMPALWAPAMSVARLSPTHQASFGSTPSSSRANLKIAGSGLATPCSPEMTTDLTSLPTPRALTLSRCRSVGPLVITASGRPLAAACSGRPERRGRVDRQSGPAADARKMRTQPPCLGYTRTPPGCGATPPGSPRSRPTDPASTSAQPRATARSKLEALASSSSHGSSSGRARATEAQTSSTAASCPAWSRRVPSRSAKIALGRQSSTRGP